MMKLEEQPEIIYEGWLHHELKVFCETHGIWHYKTEVCPLCDLERNSLAAS